MSTAPLLSVRDAARRFPVRAEGLFGARRHVHAVDGISLDIPAGITQGLVGESGCGKTTLGRLILGMDRPDAGEIAFRGTPLRDHLAADFKGFRRTVQIVHQNALGALDPRRKIGWQLAEPLDIHGIGDARERAERVAAIMAAVDLPPEVADSFPHQLSGGQAQRAVIGRALITDPEFIVCDEPVASLDVSIQARIISLLADLQARLGMAVLFISHDLRVVKRLCHRVAVMYLGQIVEEGETDDVIASPRHPYTASLISSVPELRRRRSGERIILSGDPPSPIDPPPGCRFRTRCPWARPECGARVPGLADLGNGQKVRCFFPLEKNS